MATSSKLRSMLKAQKGAATRLLTKFDSARSNPNCEEMQTIEDTLKNKVMTITDIHEKIVNTLPEDHEDEIDHEDYVFELQTKILQINSFRKVVPGKLFTGSYDGSVKVWDTSGINDDTAFGKDEDEKKKDKKGGDDIEQLSKMEHVDRNGNGIPNGDGNKIMID